MQLVLFSDNRSLMSVLLDMGVQEFLERERFRIFFEVATTLPMFLTLYDELFVVLSDVLWDMQQISPAVDVRVVRWSDSCIAVYLLACWSVVWPVFLLRVWVSALHTSI